MGFLLKLKKMNLGGFLSVIAFLIAVLPSFYTLVDSFQVFVNAVVEAQKQMVSLTEGYQYQVTSAVSEETKLNEILDNLKQLEEKQNKGFDTIVSTYSFQRGNGNQNNQQGGGAEGQSEPINDGKIDSEEVIKESDWKILPPSVDVTKGENCINGTCQTSKMQINYQRRSGLFQRIFY